MLLLLLLPRAALLVYLSSVPVTVSRFGESPGPGTELLLNSRRGIDFIATFRSELWKTKSPDEFSRFSVFSGKLGSVLCLFRVNLIAAVTLWASVCHVSAVGRPENANLFENNSVVAVATGLPSEKIEIELNGTGRGSQGVKLSTYVWEWLRRRWWFVGSSSSSWDNRGYCPKTKVNEFYRRERTK